MQIYPQFENLHAHNLIIYVYTSKSAIGIVNVRNVCHDNAHWIKHQYRKTYRRHTAAIQLLTIETNREKKEHFQSCERNEHYSYF